MEHAVLAAQVAKDIDVVDKRLKAGEGAQVRAAQIACQIVDLGDTRSRARSPVEGGRKRHFRNVDPWTGMLLASPSSSSGASGSSWLLGMPWTTISLAGSLDNRVSGSSSVPESSRLPGMPWTTFSLIGSWGYRGVSPKKSSRNLGSSNQKCAHISRRHDARARDGPSLAWSRGVPFPPLARGRCGWLTPLARGRCGMGLCKSAQAFRIGLWRNRSSLARCFTASSMLSWCGYIPWIAFSK